LHPDDVNGWLRLGRAWLLIAKSNNNCYPKALAAYDHALGLAPNNLDALRTVGDIDTKEWEYRQATTAYERYFAHGGNDPGARLSLAAAYEDAGLGYKAVSQCKTVLAQDPSSFVAELALSNAYSTVGDYSEAESALQKARSLAPDDQDRAAVDSLLDMQKDAAVLREERRSGTVASEPSEQPEGHSAQSSPHYFTIGSTKERVLAIQGTPSAVHSYVNPDAVGIEDWEYGPYGCEVEFSEPDGRVKSYDNSCGRLNIRIK
jgi:tetratricopeptide (TPR) repeat protein